MTCKSAALALDTKNYFNTYKLMYQNEERNTNINVFNILNQVNDFSVEAPSQIQIKENLFTISTKQFDMNKITKVAFTKETIKGEALTDLEILKANFDIKDHNTLSFNIDFEENIRYKIKFDFKRD